ncbi:hypothetical protein ACLESO_56410 [Pyxidicoccus sp. 3LG]
MSIRISQGSPFQLTTLKGTTGPNAPAVATSPPPQPGVQPAPQQPTDGFDVCSNRDYSKMNGQTVLRPEDMLQGGVFGIPVKGNDEGKGSEGNINGCGKPKESSDIPH